MCLFCSSFDLEWPCINYNYNPSQDIFPEDDLLEFLLSQTGDLQTGTFRMNKQQSNTVTKMNSFELDFRNELFEN